MPVALFALAIGAFGIGTTEFIIMGLLPEVADDLRVSIPTAGLLVSGYALSVTIGAPIMTALGSRVPRKPMLIGLMAVFILGNVLCALAPGYGLLMAGRAVAALCHGAFFGIGAVVAADLVTPDRRASAVSMMFTGLTVATILGVPMGTALGHAAGWRSAFWAVAALGLLGIAGIAALVPATPASDTGLRSQLRVFRDPQVWLGLLMTTLGYGGVFASFTYITPMLAELAGFSSSVIVWLLVLFGLGFGVGNILGGRLADRSLLRSLYLTLGALLVVLLVFGFTVHNPITAAITVLLLGLTGFATVAPLQTWIMDRAAGAPELASAANIAGFNLANALGAWIGGLVISAGLGYAAVNWAGALLTALGLAATVWAGALHRAGSRPVPVPA
ncbi:MFS transporter [Pseudonocardiaceae bacterium YIM PH 21723]|nr:MFS transporter [Pseudonocardiaceae bacterium YIM PH 21723]